MHLTCLPVFWARPVRISVGQERVLATVLPSLTVLTERHDTCNSKFKANICKGSCLDTAPHARDSIVQQASIRH